MGESSGQKTSLVILYSQGQLPIVSNPIPNTKHSDPISKQETLQRTVATALISDYLNACYRMEFAAIPPLKNLAYYAQPFAQNDRGVKRVCYPRVLEC